MGKESYQDETDDAFDSIGGVLFYLDAEGRPLMDEEDELLIDVNTAASYDELRKYGYGEEMADEFDEVIDAEIETDRIFKQKIAPKIENQPFRFDTSIIDGLLDDYLDGRIQPDSLNAKKIAAALREGWSEYFLALDLTEDFTEMDDDAIVEITKLWIQEKKKIEEV
jgi:hypothetical protein